MCSMLNVVSLFVIRLKPLLLYIEFKYIVFAAVPKTLSEIWCTTNWHSSTYYNYLEFSIFPAAFSIVTFRTEHNGKWKSKSKNIAMLRIVFKNCIIFFSCLLLFLPNLAHAHVYELTLLCSGSLYTSETWAKLWIYENATASVIAWLARNQCRGWFSI